LFERLPKYEFKYEKIDTNEIYVIQPYKKKLRTMNWWRRPTDSGISVWVFDDEERGLKAEPFVMGMSEMIDRFVEEQNLDPRWLTLFFSMNPPPMGVFYHLKMMNLDPRGGAWYREVKTRMCGWLCPAMLKYFALFPYEFYVWSDQR